MDSKVILNPQDVKVIKGGNSTVLQFVLLFDVGLPEGYDHSDYVVIRSKDLSREKQNKLRVLLQGEFLTSNRGRNG